jgi:hypothetical protein
MKHLNAVLATLVLSLSTGAWAAAPSEESLSRLLTVMEVQDQTEGIIKQVDEVIRVNAEKSLNGKKLNTSQQAIFDDTRAKLAVLFKKEISWASMEPVYRKAYRESFSQEEVDGMIAFYQTPTGKAVVRKQPAVTQATMAAMQEKMAAMTPQVQKIQQEMLTRLKAEAGK